MRALIAGIPMLLAACATSPPAASTAPDPASFCADVQHYMAGTSLPVQNVVHEDYQAFVMSKAQITPLQTEQYVWFEDAAHTRPKMISCKMKTVDHIRTMYGPAEVGEEGSCAGYNRRTHDAVLAGLDRGDRQRLRFDAGRHVVFDDDGALHIKAKAMRNDWLDTRYFGAPPRFRGTRYCHLIAPDYLRRVLLGDTPSPA